MDDRRPRECSSWRLASPGRRDDGLGLAVAERLRHRRLQGVTSDANYQLNVEDALACAEHDTVVFVNRRPGLRQPFRFTMFKLMKWICWPSATPSARPPSWPLPRSSTGSGRRPWLLAVRGRSFAVGEGLTARGRARPRTGPAFPRGLPEGVPATTTKTITVVRDLLASNKLAGGGHSPRASAAGASSASTCSARPARARRPCSRRWPTSFPAPLPHGRRYSKDVLAIGASYWVTLAEQQLAAA